MTEAWKESLKRIRQGEERERELRREKPWPRYPLFSSQDIREAEHAMWLRECADMEQDIEAEMDLYADALEDRGHMVGAARLRFYMRRVFHDEDVGPLYKMD